MKKLFLIVPCLLVCFMMLVVPAHASEPDITIEFSGGYGESGVVPEFEKYSISVLVDGVEVFNGEHTFSESEMEYNCWFSYLGEQYWLGISVTPAGTVVDTYLDDGTVVMVQISSLEPEPTNASIFDVFSGVSIWLVDSLGDSTSLFWNSDAGIFTFLGDLAICSLGFAAVFVLFGFIQKALCLKG